MKQTFSVSIVIPVYNEAAHLAACLDAIAVQTVQPSEVIVVDNNSTDDTVTIARKYDFVTVVREKRQGVIHARNRGFNLASGEVIGRIDADTVIREDWVETVHRIFAEQSVDAVSGRANYHDMTLAPLLGMIDLKIRSYLARTLGDEVAMQGANMAIRRSVWNLVKHDVCQKGGLHEDLDLSVHVNWRGFSVRFDPSMVASLGYRQAGSSYMKFVEYVMLSPRTYAQHGLTSQRHMYPVCALAIICFWPLKVLHRGYDKQSGKFSWSRFFSADEQRVNPATFVDY